MGAENTYYPGTVIIHTNGHMILCRGSYNGSVWMVILYGEYHIE